MPVDNLLDRPQSFLSLRFLMETKDIWTILLSSSSLVVALFALYMNYFPYRLRVRVQKMMGIIGGQSGVSEPIPLIQIINMSNFAVTIAEVGHRIPRTKYKAAWINAASVDGTNLPIRLEPRTSVSLYNRSRSNDDIPTNSRMYVRLDTGTVCKSSWIRSTNIGRAVNRWWNR